MKATIYKIYRILGNFLSSSRSGELLLTILVPLLPPILLIFSKIDVIAIDGFVDTILTVASLLASFEIASITILMTSPSKNIEYAKKKPTNKERKNLEGFGISYYQLILIRNFYVIFILLLTIAIGLILKILLSSMSLTAQKILLGVELFLLSHGLIVLVMVLIHMYHLLWDEKLTKDDIIGKEHSN